MDSRIRIQNLLNDVGDKKETSVVAEVNRTSPVSSDEFDHSPGQDSEIDPQNKKVNRAKKEQQRRSRMNQFFDELKAILPKEKDKLEVSRITKEEVLEKSVEYIELLRGEIRTLKRRRGVGDPSSIIGISQNEIDAGFNVLYPLEYAKFSSIYDNDQLSHMHMSLFRLKELSDKSSRDEHRLATYFMQHMLLSAYEFHPEHVIDSVTTTLNIYSRIKTAPEGSEPFFMYFRTDLKVLCLCNMAVAMAHMGRYDDSDKFFAKAMKFVNKLNHKPSRNMLHLFMRQLYCIRGDPLPKEIGLEILGALRDDPIWCNHGPLYYYTSLLENGEVDNQLIDQMSDYVEKISRLYGSMSQSTMSGLYVYMLSKIDKPQSLEYLTREIEKYRKFNISSTFCLPEFLRLKATVMMDLDRDLQMRDEIEANLNEAKKTAEELHWKNLELKILIQMVKFYQRANDQQKLACSIKELTNSLYHIKMHSKNNPPSSIIEAQLLVNKQ